jgi:hypothetical protein
MLFFVVILINFNYIRKIIKSSLGATEGLVQQQFGSIALFSIKTTFDFPLENLILARNNTFHEVATAPS